MNELSNGLRAASVVLQLVLLFLLVRGHLRKYFILFVYSLAQLAVTGLEQWVFYGIGQGPLYRNLFWTDEIVMDLLMFVLVITLTYQALEDSPLRAPLGKLLIATLIVALVLPFAVYYRYPIFSTRWFNGASQILNFGAAIMNLALWTALIGKKKRDPQLLMVTLGLGLVVAGQAIGFGLRQFTTGGGDAREAANLFLLIIHLTGVAVWCCAFRQTPGLDAKPPLAA
jgi:hypothetical protein